jgi:hypothetical protein
MDHAACWIVQQAIENQINIAGAAPGAPCAEDAGRMDYAASA